MLICLALLPTAEGSKVSGHWGFLVPAGLLAKVREEQRLRMQVLGFDLDNTLLQAVDQTTLTDCLEKAR